MKGTSLLEVDLRIFARNGLGLGWKSCEYDIVLARRVDKIFMSSIVSVGKSILI